MQLEQPLAGYNGKPEIDDGHTKIANELLDAIIQADFSKRQLKILLFIMRKTYGWNKPEDDIARSQMVDATNMHNPHITKTIQELLEMNVIIVSQGSHAKRYRINKYYDTWRMTEMVIVTKTVTKPKLVIVTETVTESYQNSNNSLLKQSPQKTTPKDNQKILSEFDIFWKEYPRKEGKKKALDSWVKKKPNIEFVMNVLSWQKKLTQWQDVQFVPMGQTYINQERWLDENPNNQKQERGLVL
jgi:phage replication O-like protein O